MLETPAMTTASGYCMNVYSLSNQNLIYGKTPWKTVDDTTGRIYNWEEKNNTISKSFKNVNQILKETFMKRIVQVFIVDTDKNVPLDKSILYMDEKPKLTDLTDQELFFEIPIQEILKKHNDDRKVMLDKEASKQFGKEIFLDPVKVRDLSMHVVTLAQF